jgi:hypothetical protein
MMEGTYEIYNCESDIENVNPIYSNDSFRNNNDRIESIGDSIRASLLNSNLIKKDIDTCDTTLRTFIVICLFGIMILLSVVVYLIILKT